MNVTVSSKTVVGVVVGIVLSLGLAFSYTHYFDHGQFHRVISWVNTADPMIVKMQQRITALEKKLAPVPEVK